MSKSSFSAPFVRFSGKEQTLFAKRLSFLVKANIPIVESLYLIRKQTKSRSKVKIFESVINDVSNGQYLATSLSKFGTIFGEFTVNIIRVGELSGILGQNLQYLAEELTKKQALRAKVVGALVYPLFITVATLGVTSLITAFIFPKLMPIFSSLHIQLPLTTRMLIAVSAYLCAWGVATLLAMAVFVCVVVLIRSKSEKVRLLFDGLACKVPLMGAVMKSYNLANFCRTLGLLLKSGVSLPEAISISADTTRNLVYQKAYRVLAKNVTKGEPISRTLERMPALFPDTMTYMISIGETTGDLTATLAYLSDLYEAEVDELTKNLSSSIE